MTSVHEIVILGGNFAGVDLVHHLQRQVLPLLKKAAGQTKFHISLVSPNTHFFFKVAAPRALINTTLISEEKIFKSLAEGFKQYGESVTLVRGKAAGLSPETRSVSVELVGGGSQQLKYDTLFIATGTTSTSPLWTLHDDHQASLDALHKLHAALPNAKTVLISGGGPVGVETAGEITAAYPNAKITLVVGGGILSTLKAGTIAKAKKLLADAKVDVLTNTRVTQATTEGASTVVELSNGESKTVDIYIDGTGATKINSEYLPKSWLDSTGRVTTRDAYFRVKGDSQADVSGIYVVGDIVAGSTNTAIEMNAQVTTAASSFAVDVLSKLGGKTGSSGGLLSFIPGFGSKGVAQKEFKPMKDTMIVPFGPSAGVGQAMGWSLPTFAVKKGKAEHFLINMVEPAVTGSKYPQL
ncbi:FAD/NAD(P)-binding domain-containing protein [Melanomma pulvis-pyrius CBS 109.77]|uniref:FAD/NAD(P)-binding domain-containing protein n=1 Tax=Melanomma pulvis-pyrius CBS 109.77 TaxID=1314802 RepID=A0A6A6X5C7_9PLEO|nr:FAD/NAD(P)-binding domain-containing protein [Melanomma pulvis-pyrius CBS 109.77]